jgi:hypothetical protein
MFANATTLYYKMKHGDKFELGKQRRNAVNTYKNLLFSPELFNFLRYCINVKRNISACDSGGHFLLE